MATLFDPVQIGDLQLKNRIVMAPLTRMRNFNERSPGPINVKHYVQRASAGLIITEATSVTPQGVGYPDTPGLWSDAQISGWRSVTSAVHDAGGLVVAQLWHVGRVSDPVYHGGRLPVAPSAIAPEGQVNRLNPKRPYPVPRRLETDEIPGLVEDFRVAAENALRAGFDGAALHAANGYLFDQFLHDGSNKRTDRYGGPIQNRARFLMETVDALLTVWPAGRIGVHLNLMSSSYSMSDTDPRALFSYVADQLGARKIAFIFAREALDRGDHLIGREVRRLFKGAYIVNEGLTKDSAQQAIERGEADAAAFGRLFIANPDLVERFRRGAALNAIKSETIYTDDETGYNDYPLLGEAAE
ncbi:alkene reductase [Phyllobacterium bourgognense]|uniref:2,4-dienoyl-CoA reductase-like NADH-dependent reductase (Old Yellow Enzyme family) n=1 Tax=Phyllobacterium bourgognense TaxID=314236 RepID=A0A368YLP4_9HYPH|nr:alkene reductase [Phyllobacterium bourgognense]RCW81161.1 2,4-dienoyl-CoA reductase-like NADH-dependent reductase (Old Yellow Enzyme family) [Phyllobacterium bourgognense]